MIFLHLPKMNLLLPFCGRLYQASETWKCLPIYIYDQLANSEAFISSVCDPPSLPFHGILSTLTPLCSTAVDLLVFSFHILQLHTCLQDICKIQTLLWHFPDKNNNNNNKITPQVCHFAGPREQTCQTKLFHALCRPGDHGPRWHHYPITSSSHITLLTILGLK